MVILRKILIRMKTSIDMKIGTVTVVIGCLLTILIMSMNGLWGVIWIPFVIALIVILF